MKSRRVRKSCRGGNFSLPSLGNAASAALVPGALYLGARYLRSRKNRSKSRRRR
jgi:hypothetical protein